jgi:hypothetical protein
VRSLERRIDACLPKALKIIRPEEYPGYAQGLSETKHRHRWQHVDACERAVADAIRQVDAIELPVDRSKIMDQIRAVERGLAKIIATSTTALTRCGRRSTRRQLRPTSPP